MSAKPSPLDDVGIGSGYGLGKEVESKTGASLPRRKSAFFALCRAEYEKYKERLLSKWCGASFRTT